MLDIPADLPSQAEQHLHFHFGRLRSADQMSQRMHQRIGFGTVQEMDLFQSRTQIGEFSFILADLGIGLKVLPDEARGLILGASILSIFLNPLLFALAARREASPNIAPAPDIATYWPSGLQASPRPREPSRIRSSVWRRDSQIRTVPSRLAEARCTESG